LTGAGLDDLKRAIIASAVGAGARDANALARLAIDRVFTMKGFGTVVTGTLVAGTICREDELQVYPTGRFVRVRGVQVHGAPADAAIAGQRTALNLAGASTDDLARGMTLAPAATFETTRRADVLLRLLPTAPRALKDRARVHLHSFTMETVAEVALYASAATAMRPQLAPGQEIFARIKLPEASLLLPGDRFIIRQFSPVVTIGGGIVLDAAPMPRKRHSDDFLRLLASGDEEAILMARVARRGQQGISLSRLISETGWTKSTVESRLQKTLQAGSAIRVGDLLLHLPALEALKQHVVETAKRFHARNPLVAGISREELRAQVQASTEVFNAALAMLLREKKIEIINELVRLAGQGVAMRDEEAESKKKIEDAFALAGLKVPALAEVMAGLKVDKARAQKLVTLLLRDKVLIKISDELVFHRGALEQLRAGIAAYKKKSARIDVAAFKDLTGVSRKYAIPLLEYLDRERVTRRVGDAREIL
jgi:selenocysteine-specific elongation factor